MKGERTPQIEDSKTELHTVIKSITSAKTNTAPDCAPLPLRYEPYAGTRLVETKTRSVFQTSRATANDDPR